MKIRVMSMMKKMIRQLNELREMKRRYERKEEQSDLVIKLYFASFFYIICYKKFIRVVTLKMNLRNQKRHLSPQDLKILSEREFY